MTTSTQEEVGRVALGLAALLLCIGAANSHADSTFVYAVQISVTAQASPPQITLQWEADPYGANSYVIYRKAKTDTDWGAPIANLDGSSSSFADAAVVAGSAYEYQVIKNAALGYTGYGYIFSGINAPVTESRGTVVLVVANESVTGLDSELGTLQSDLVGDGWTVMRHNVSVNDSPESVRSLIQADYYADPSNVNTVFLFGHVPILQSGYLDYDGHGARPMPADAYYGDMNNDWPTDPATSPSYLPSDVALMIGRVDLANMPGNGAPMPWPSETELLRNYLNKDHNWRQKLFTVNRRALMGNRRGDEGGLATAASGYRNFEPFVGAGNTVEADIQDSSPVAQRWVDLLSAGNYLWAYGCGAGQDTSISYLGTSGTYQEVWSTDIVGDNAQAVFVMVFGSHLGNWDHTDNLMRAVLATPSCGLACCMSGEPHWFCHHMGLGETIGYSTRLSLNNSTLYQSQLNTYTRAVYIALMGDPTLRMEPVAPVPWLNSSPGVGRVDLTWGTSSDPVAGYYVYRATSGTGPFTRVSPSLVGGTNFSDLNVPSGNYTYMVRGIALHVNPSGSYFDPSQAVFAVATVASSPNSILLQGQPGLDGFTLMWNSQAGAVYRIQSADRLNPPNWTDVSGPVQASSATTSWTDAGVTGAQHFYRVVAY